MNMVKEGIQTRRRRQKNSATPTASKFKSTKSATTTTTVVMAKPAQTLIKDIKTPLINNRESPYSYSELYPATYPRLFTNARPSSFDAEMLSQQLMPNSSTNDLPTSNDEHQRLKIVRTNNPDQL